MTHAEYVVAMNIFLSTAALMRSIRGPTNFSRRGLSYDCPDCRRMAVVLTPRGNSYRY